MDEGSVCIMDTGMWHKAGDSSNTSRWSIFSIYTGWFVKPYYDYEVITKKKLKKFIKNYFTHTQHLQKSMKEEVIQ